MKPMGWPPARSGTILRLGEKRARSLRLGERDSVLIASSGIIAWVIVKKWTRYEFGLGQGRLGIKKM